VAALAAPVAALVTVSWPDLDSLSVRLVIAAATLFGFLTAAFAQVLRDRVSPPVCLPARPRGELRPLLWIVDDRRAKLLRHEARHEQTPLAHPQHPGAAGPLGGCRVVRLFAAILIPQEVAADLDAAVAPYRDDVLRWTTSDSWHLTLAFYGQVDDTRVPDLKSRLTRAAKRYQALSLTLKGAGQFNRRALWVGCEGDLVPLRALARSAAAAGQRVGASASESRFKAHLTLARASTPTDLRPYVSILRNYRGPSWTGDAVALVQSHLGAGENRRARYETLSSHRLSGPVTVPPNRDMK
jgi:2'-5' RNA ligase